MEFLILRWLHIVLGAFWVGAGIAMGWFIIPALGEAGPGGRPVMQGLLARRFPVIMSAVGGLTVLVGLRMYMLVYSAAWIASLQGITLTIGAVLGLAALIVGSGVQARNAKRMGALGAAIAAGGGPPTAEQQAEMGALQVRMKNTANVLAWLMLGALVLMPAARLFAGS